MDNIVTRDGWRQRDIQRDKERQRDADKERNTQEETERIRDIQRKRDNQKEKERQIREWQKEIYKQRQNNFLFHPGIKSSKGCHNYGRLY